MPLFSVLLPTRNRATLFASALGSVLAQECRDLEVVVVDDGSDEADAARCRALCEADARVRLVVLARRSRGHGQSYALNEGAQAARGRYLCFLDDDDSWTDSRHLARVSRLLTPQTALPDLVLCNQQAFRAGEPLGRTVWIEDLEPRLARAPDALGAYTVTPEELLACQAHCHVNTTIVRRDFYLELGGFEEGLRYECDRDFYLRAIDRAALIRFLPQVVARHNVPDPKAGTAMSTALSDLERRLYQLRVFDRIATGCARAALRRYALRQRVYTLGHVASASRAAGHRDSARLYAREARLARLLLVLGHG
ncbi:MAG: glycosyltransferase family 2 protein [Rhodospirillales bacterium]|nr:glycosyltransferase family 2 protein [Rhodospirillales bacterium]